jgi:diguanylate cyclase (GGDEF)-like protein
MAGKSGGLKKAPPDGRTPVPAPPWDPVLSETLYDLLYRADLGQRDLGADLERLGRVHGDTVYSELIYLLSHLRLDPGEARECWEGVVTHRGSMQERLGTDLDLRVALVSYFLEVNRKLKNPKIIELKVFEETQAFAYRDELTGLCNFRYFREYLSREIHRGERYNPPLSLIMVDIDDFKIYNDSNGHEAGNRALATMARLLADPLRKIDVAARYGGEEFAVILPSTTKTGAHQVAERARETIEKYPFPNADSQPGGQLTVSMGVATYPADAREPNDLVRYADSALYVAKTRGKNQVHLYGQNRRSYTRIKAALDGTFCVLAAEYHPLTTIDLSEGGLLFFVDRPLNLGALMDINLTLPGSGHEISASGRVVRLEERGAGRFEAGIRIIDISTKDQILLAKYVRAGEPARSAGERDGRTPGSAGRKRRA